MRIAKLLLVLPLLAACQSQDLGAYHHELAHPYRQTETSQRLALGTLAADQAAEAARQFAAQRPNNGSTFIVSAPTEMAMAARAGILDTGVSPGDVRIVPEGNPAQILRTDRRVSVDNCQVAPAPRELSDYLFGGNDGFGYDAANGRLLGCAVRRNIGAMVDDPRTLNGPVEAGTRDGAVAADVYGKYTKGQSPVSKRSLPSWNTSEATKGGEKQ